MKCNVRQGATQRAPQGMIYPAQPMRHAAPGSSRITAVGLIAAAFLYAASALGQELMGGRPSLILQNPAARLVMDLGGGSLREFRFRGDLNPLSWAAPAPDNTAAAAFGHFLCLDRWGPPSDAEGARGMPYHGEASHVPWQITRDAETREGLITAELSATLPKAGLSVRRTIRMSSSEAVFAVQEEVKNRNALGRIYNMVQHPTIAPPFLDESTLVDCNGRHGFAQGGSLPHPEEPSFYWPQGLNEDGETINLRRMTNSASPSVVSLTIDGKYGWITAATPGRGLLIGYIWLTKDYAWVSHWRDVHDGRPAARGLEFGTTGLHQPFPILVQKRQIWDQPLFEYLDADETSVKRYAAFLLKIPADFAGVQSLDVQDQRLIVHERGGSHSREFRISTDGLIPN